MKPLLLIPVLTLPLLLAACETTVVERHPRHSGYYERDSRYHHGPYVRDVAIVESRPSYYRTESVVERRPSYYRTDSVVEPRPGYRNPDYAPRTTIRYYNDSRGRYYYNGSRRIYVNAGVIY